MQLDANRNRAIRWNTATPFRIGVCSYYGMLGYDTILFIRFEYEIKMYRMHLTISSLRSIQRWTGCKANAKIRHSNSGPNLILFHVIFSTFFFTDIDISLYVVVHVAVVVDVEVGLCLLFFFTRLLTFLSRRPLMPIPNMFKVARFLCIV